MRWLPEACEDLYYRLAEIAKIPTLAERPGDAVLLARHFAKRFARELNPHRGGLGPTRWR
jgi:two-component system NtrC family response regulator